MTRKKKQPDSGLYPDPGDGQLVDWLPRDIRQELSSAPAKGQYLAGWDTVTDTFQLWRLVEVDPPRAEFVGYVVGAPPGGIKGKK